MKRSYRKMEEAHLQKLEEMHVLILQLTKNQKTNLEKIQLAEDFKSKFDDSKVLLSDKILSFQHEILLILSKNDLIG